MRKVYKILVIIALSLATISLLPRVATVWAETGSDSIKINPASSIPLGQGEQQGRPPSSVADMIIQFGDNSDDISGQSDGSGVEIVPGAAFVHTGELGTGSEANDWYFSFLGGYLQSDSAVNNVCLAAPVYLPVDSIITGFTVYAFDNFGPGSVFVYLDRTYTFGGWDELAAIQTINGGAIQSLTDPSINSVDNVNIVAPYFNYHVDFCLPANSGFTTTFGSDIRIYGAKITYILQNRHIYLPVLLKGVVPPPTKLYISNNTGGNLTYTVFGTPEGNKSCTIGNGASNQLCATFTAGRYNWQVVTVCSPPTASGIKDFPPGDKILTPFFCR